MDDVQCAGAEATLQECRYSSTHNCGHSEDAGVECHGERGFRTMLCDAEKHLLRLGMQPAGQLGSQLSSHCNRCMLLGVHLSPSVAVVTCDRLPLLRPPGRRSVPPQLGAK